jgi:hypothetical protein
MPRPIALRHADALYAELAHGRWTGSRLVSVSSDLDPIDVPAHEYPPGLLIEEDEDELLDGATPEEMSLFGMGLYDSHCDDELSLYQLGHYRYTNATAIIPRHDCRSGCPSNSSSGGVRDGNGGYCGGVGPDDLRHWLECGGLHAGSGRRWPLDLSDKWSLCCEVLASDARYADMCASLSAAAPARRGTLFPPHKT